MCRECFNDESLVKDMREAQLIGEDEGLKRKPAEVKPSQEVLMTMKEGASKASQQASTDSIFA